MLRAFLLLQATLPAQAPVFTFETDEFWLNLHQFLYVLGRAEAKAIDATREAVVQAPEDAARGLARASEAERQRWRQAVSFYAGGLSRRDAVFYDPLIELAGALSRVGDVPRLPRMIADSELAATLDRAGPIYRKLWWPAHRAANRQWHLSIDSLVAKHGATVLEFLERVYGLPWPAHGYPVHVTAYANWAGAFSTKGNLLIVSSLDTAIRKLYGLETLFHEAMHQWDEPVNGMIDEEAGKLGVPVPASVSHGIIFFTAGEAIRKVAPEHVPYAEAFGVWQRRWMAMRDALKEEWKPYLDGQGTREEAVARVLMRLAPP
jgi:hypothetical protein